MLKRSVEIILQEAMNVAPSVLLTGARQVGKSTLALSLGYEYRVFDDLTQREAASSDPLGFVASLPRPVVLDEIQKAPQTLEGIKFAIDQNRQNGDFLLTGSANVLDMRAAKDSLAGRIIEVPIWPLSQKEIAKKPDENLLDKIVTESVASLKPARISSEQILTAIVLGGYPEIQKIPSKLGRSLWFDSYISTYVERDIRDIGELRDIAAFIRFFNLLAPRSCGLVNKSELANVAQLNAETLGNYLHMLEMIYQISLLPAYSSNVSKRFVKSPKFYMTDSGVLSHLLGVQTAQELQESASKGAIVETFVYCELLKHLSYAQTRAEIFHYRTSDQKEIDFVVETSNQILAIEVKSGQTLTQESFKHIVDFQAKSAKKVIGIVFYTGEHLLSFGDENHQRFAVPLSVFF